MMKLQRFRIMILVLLLALAPLPTRSAPCRAALYTVTNTNDSGAGSLRWAINQANVDGDESLIIFAIPGSGVHTIQPLTPLPALVEDTTQICGHTQPGWAPATDTTPATIVVEIDGSLAGPGNGFTIISANNWIAGLAINRFEWNGVAIFPFGGSSATNNAVFGNHIGTDPTGMVDLGNGYTGVSISLGAQDNVVGGISPDMRNVISGNGWEGVGIHGENTTGNIILDNYIGTAANGADPLGNALHGVRIYGGAHHNTVGGDEANWRNVIAGNDRDGVYIAGDGTRGNVVAGNYIGLRADGTYTWQMRNGETAITITGDAQANTVGGDSEGERNIILFREIAVLITGTQTMSNVVSGNFIGTITGTVGIINNFCCDGVVIAGGAHHNTIGGTTTDERNVIAGGWTSNCYSADVRISDADTRHNVVSGNHIGVDVSGTVRLSRSSYGVWIDDGAQDNVVGGDTDGERNVISSKDRGVYIADAGSTGNVVTGNYIGTNATGTGAVAYSDYGVYIALGAQDNVVGGDTPAKYNVISGHRYDGVYIASAGTTGNTISGNYIGTGKDGTGALGNERHGVQIIGDAQSNTIGPGNVIAYNAWDGVWVNGGDTFGNVVTRNSIFANTTGISLTNGANGSIAAPVIDATTPGSVLIVGTACPGCTVEVFENADPDGEGETYVGEATADTGGTFTVTVGSLSEPYLTATATDAISGTSEFSAVYTHTVYSVFLPLVMSNY